MNIYDEYLSARHVEARDYQVGKGRTFDLTLSQLYDLLSESQRKTIKKHLAAGTIDGFMKSKWGYVIGWTDKAAFIRGVMDATTAKIQTRSSSEFMNRIQKGDKQSDRARAKISRKLTGRRHSEAHVEARSAAQRGVKRGPMTEAHKAKIRAAALAREAAKRA